MLPCQISEHNSLVVWLSSPLSSHCAESVVIPLLMGKKGNEKESNIIHTHAMKACRWNGGVVSLILNLSTGMR